MQSVQNDIDEDDLAAESSGFRIGLSLFGEQCLFFGAVLALEYAVFGPGWIATTQPHVFWIPVVFMALQFGTIGGLMAAMIAIALSVATGWVPQGINEDFYEFTGRVLKNPVLWLAAAILIGELRRSQLVESSIQRRKLLLARQQRDTISDYCQRLMTRSSAIERRLNCREHSSPEELLSALSNMRSGPASQFHAALASAGDILFSADQLTLYLMAPGGKLVRVVGDGPEDTGRSVPLGRGLVQAVISERLFVSDANVRHQVLLADHGTMAGPLLNDNGGGQVLGMVVVKSNDAWRHDSGMAAAFEQFCAELALSLGMRGTQDLMGGEVDVTVQVLQSDIKAVGSDQPSGQRQIEVSPRRVASS